MANLGFLTNELIAEVIAKHETLNFVSRNRVNSSKLLSSQKSSS